MKQVTFWQVLGVIFLLLVLAALLFPVFAQAKSGGYRKSCLGNVRQLATAMQLYVVDHDDRLPPRDRWMESIDSLIKNPYVYRCRELLHLKNDALYGLAFNRELSCQPIPAKPGEVALIFDSVNLARNASGGLDSLPIPGRHKGRNTIAWADGHATTVQTK